MKRLDPLLEELLIVMYPEPDECDSLEEFARSRHEDIPGLDLDGVNAHRWVARTVWAARTVHGAEVSEWLLDRLARLDREAERRRGRARHDA